MIRGALVILGRQGAGKGTQCVRLVAPLRRARTSRPATCSAPRSRRAPSSAARPRSTWTRASCVPDDVMIGIVDERLHQATTPPPRASSSTASPAPSARPRRSTTSPATARSTWSSTSRCREDVVLERLAGRRVCVDCGANYSRRRRRPSTTGRATSAAARSIQRDDDTEEAIAPAPRPLRRARPRRSSPGTTRARACCDEVDGVGTPTTCSDRIVAVDRRRASTSERSRRSGAVREGARRDRR